MNYLQMLPNRVTLESSIRKKVRPDTLIPIAYFSGSFGRTQATLEYNTERMLCSLQIHTKAFIFQTGAECTLYCDHKPLAPFLTTGMLSHVLDRWVLELQQFNIKYNHTVGKKTVLADMTSRLKALNLYETHQEVDSVPSVATVEDALKKNTE